MRPVYTPSIVDLLNLQPGSSKIQEKIIDFENKSTTVHFVYRIEENKRSDCFKIHFSRKVDTFSSSFHDMMSVTIQLNMSQRNLASAMA